MLTRIDCGGNTYFDNLTDSSDVQVIDGCLFQWLIDSAALGNWHVGQGPYSSAMKVLKANGVKTDHIVRQVG